MQTIIALTSASGELIVDDYVYSSIQKVLFEDRVEKIYFTGFSQCEAMKFLNETSSDLTFNKAKIYTGYNPSLLSLATRCNTLDELSTTIFDAVVRFVNSNLPDNNSIKTIYIDHLKSSDYFLKKAINGDLIDEYEKKEYFSTWIYKHHAYYEIQDDPLVIRLNFPLLPNILHKVIIELPHHERTNLDITENHIVKGILLEHTFLSTLRATHLQMFTLLWEGTCERFKCFLNTNYHSRCIALPKLYKSILYQLRFGHPVIDGVRLLADQYNKHFLVFFQVSLSKYSDHGSKVNGLCWL